MPAQFQIPKAIYGAIQMKQSGDALRRLANQPEPTFRSADSILREAEGKTPSGYTGQEKAAFQQSLARLGMQKYRQASQVNPNMASNINAGINYGNIGAQNEFAKNDASLRRDRINRLVNGITNEDNRNVSTAIQNRRMLQEQYGQAYQAGIGNVFNYFDALDRDAATVASIVTGMPTGGGGGNGGGMSSLGGMVGGKSGLGGGGGAVGGGINGRAMGANAAEPVGSVPYDNSWKPYATQEPAQTYPQYNNIMQKWITNPNNMGY